MNSEHHLREIKCCIGQYNRPDGSVLWSQGSTVVAAGTYGPVEVRMQNIQIDKTTVEVHFRPKAGLPNIGDKLHEEILKNTIEVSLVAVLYPRSSVVVIIQEMQNCGGLVACAVNAACMALLNSGIDMRFLLAAVNCIVDQSDKLHLDPNQIESNHSKASFTFVFDNINKNIITSQTTGSFTIEQYKEAIELCKSASEKIFQFYKSTMSKQITNFVN